MLHTYARNVLKFAMRALQNVTSMPRTEWTTAGNVLKLAADVLPHVKPWLHNAQTNRRLLFSF
jgi:hypothetical protein